MRSSSFYRLFKRKWILDQLWKSFLKYATEFEQVLYIHLTSEFEVSLLDGEITSNCRRTLGDLQKNFDLLDFNSKIVEILEDNVSTSLRRIPLHELELYYSIKDDLVKCILKIARRIMP